MLPSTNSTLFPYTTLFRSPEGEGRAEGEGRDQGRERRDLEVTEKDYEQREGRSAEQRAHEDRKSTRLNSSHPSISYAVFCLKKKTNSLHTLPPSPHITTVL